MFPNLKFACRALLKSPGFTAVAVLTIAVAIGANTALFSIFNKLVLHPIDLPDAGRLVRIWTNNPDRNVVAPIMSVPKYELFRDSQQSFSGFAASGFNSHILTRPDAEPEQLTSLNVTAGWVPTLGLKLTRGRNFTADEDKPGGAPVTLLSYAIWKTHFGQRDSIIGETVMLNGIGHTVIGILPETLPAPIAGTQLVVPYPLEPPGLTREQIQGGAGFLQITARLKPGVTFEQAAAEVKTISQHYKDAFPGHLDTTNNNELRSWIEEQVGPVRATFYTLLIAVAFVLLIACANVSNLFLSRLTARHKEIAIRLSMGATRGQLIRQFLTETALFSLIAAGLGVLFAVWALAGLENFLASQLPPNTTFPLDSLTLAFTAGLSVLACLTIGLVPALAASRVKLSEVLKDSARGSSGARGVRFRGFLIVAEVALSVMLLIGSGLLLASFIKLTSTSPGFQSKGIASAFVSLPGGRYATAAQQADFVYRVSEKLRTYPQVKLAGASLGLPLSGFSPRAIYAVQGQPIPPTAQRPVANLNVVTEDYFAMLHIPLKEGRLFTPLDREGVPTVIVVSETFAKHLFPNESAIGKVLLRGANADIKLEIVGIVGDVKSNGLNAVPPDSFYYPLRQFGRPGLALLASTDGDPAALQGLMRSAVAAVDNTIAISFFSTLDNTVQTSFGFQKIVAWLTGIFAGVALVLSAVGLYSVLAYAVTQRTSEIGIRMALGAAKGQVVSLVLSQGMKLVALGLVIGLGASAAGSRLLASLLYQIEPLDPLVFGGVTVLFAVVAAFACLLPSLRAARIDPIIALRTD